MQPDQKDRIYYILCRSERALRERERERESKTWIFVQRYGWQAQESQELPLFKYVIDQIAVHRCPGFDAATGTF